MSETYFELLSSTPVASLGIELRQYRHGATGARHYHFDCADTNNAFMVAFPTLPENSTGVAHILEHTTLCGSVRYPVRDPFFNMLRRSLNTFMNAFTGTDSTAYPFATQNRKDFDNLLAVYLDAVFFPTLHPLDFAQEGWRLECDTDASGVSQLAYHGVVYNEMKGAMSAPMAQLFQHLHAALFPDVIYRHNSGGDPFVIPELSYAALKAFHARHYHPGNAVFMTYGSFSEKDHQKRIAELVLKHFERPEAEIVSPLQARFSAPREVAAAYDVDEMEVRGTHIIWAWLLGETADPDAFIDAHVMTLILLEHSASPLRQLLETTELADAPSELCGLDDSTRQLVFLCGVEGSEAGHAESLQSAVIDLLERVARDGIGQTALEAIVDRLELAQCDIGSAGSYPFGLVLMQRLMPAAMYRRDPVPLLELAPAIQRLRQAITAPDFVAGLIARNLLRNRHRVRVVMSPDAEKRQRDEVIVRERLRMLRQTMTPADLTALETAALALRERQGTADDPDVLPRVTLADVPAAMVSPSPRVHSAGGLEIHEYACAANGVFRIQVAYELPLLSAQDFALLPLLSEYLTEFGAGRADYLDVQKQRAQLGLFSAHAVTRSRLDDANDVRGWMVVAAKGLARKRDALIGEAGRILASVRFDETERLRELLVQSRAEAEQSITDRGHLLALMTAARGLSPGARIDELWDGPNSIRMLKELGRAQVAADELAEVFASFERIRRLLLSAPRRVLVIGDGAALDKVTVPCDAFRAVPGEFIPFVPRFTTVDERNGWLANSQINFCAKAYAAIPEDTLDAPALAVLGCYLTDGFLHAEIREKGGAYGAGAGYDADSCTFRFYSYRDPRATATLADFDRALAWLAQSNDEQRLEESILGIIRKLDQPRPPTGEAERAFFNRLYDRTDEFRQRYRARVLAVTHDDLRRVATQFLRPELGHIGVVASSTSEAELASLGIEFARL